MDDENIDQDYVDEQEIFEEVTGIDEEVHDMQTSEDEEMESGIPGVPLIKDDSKTGFFGHDTMPVYAVAICPSDSSIACSGGGDDKAYLWNTSTGEPIKELSKHEDSIVEVAFNFDGKYVLIAGMDGIVNVHSVPSGEPVCKLDGPEEIVCATWHPKGNIVVVGSIDGTIWMWNVPKGQLMGVFSKHEESVNCVEFLPDGKKLVSAGSDGSLILWDPQMFAPVWKILKDEKFHMDPVISLSISPDSKVIATGDEAGRTCLVSVASHKIVNTLEGHEGSVESILFCLAANWLITGSSDGKVLVWDLDTGRIRSTLTQENPCSHLKFYDDSTVVSASGTLVTKWNYKTGQVLNQLMGHQDVILTLDVQANQIVSGGDDGVCLVFQ